MGLRDFKALGVSIVVPATALWVVVNKVWQVEFSTLEITLGDGVRKLQVTYQILM